MWSDAARAASAEARKKGASGHNAGTGNRKVAAHVKNQHKETLGHKAARYALTAAVAPGAVVAIGGVVAARGIHYLIKGKK